MIVMLTNDGMHTFNNFYLHHTLMGNSLFESWVFWLTFLSSWISSSFGLAKCLKIGVAGVIGQKGPFDGLLSGQFVLAFFGNPKVMELKL